MTQSKLNFFDTILFPMGYWYLELYQEWEPISTHLANEIGTNTCQYEVLGSQVNECKEKDLEQGQGRLMAKEEDLVKRMAIICAKKQKET